MSQNQKSWTDHIPQTQGRKCLVIDNYDSFTFNLVQYLQALKVEVTTVRNDELDSVRIQDFDFASFLQDPALQIILDSVLN